MRLFQDLVIVLLSRKACSEVPQYLDIYINTEDQIETHVKDKKVVFFTVYRQLCLHHGPLNQCSRTLISWKHSVDLRSGVTSL